MGIYGITGTQFSAFVFRYDPAAGVTPLYSSAPSVDVAAWWIIGSNNELTTYSLHSPLSVEQVSRIVAELNEAEGFENTTVNASGELKADLVISEVTVIPL